MEPRLTICLVSVLVLGSRLPAFADEGELYTALKQNVLFARAGLRPSIGISGAPASGPGFAGIVYRVEASAPGLRIDSFQMGVHPSRSAARVLAERMVQSMSIGPDTWAPGHDPCGDIGDERYVWSGGGEGSGTIVFLRQNIFVDFCWVGENAQALALARRIDELIRTDREVARRGTLGPTPEIVAAGAPAQAAKKARLTITPEFRGLGERADLRIAVMAPDGFSSLTETTREGKSRPDIVVRGPRADSLSDTVRKRRPDEDGRFIMHIPDKVGPAKLTMIVATPDNVFVTKEFSVNVTE